MKTLIVEDDPSIAEVLQTLISQCCHYAVDIAADGETGLQMAGAFEYDLMLLDVWLPGLDGLTLCRQLREQGCRVPILLVTAQADAQQKAKALNAGADDYIVKPFNAEELIARVQALLRRGGPKTQPVLKWGSLLLDPVSLRAMYGPRSLSLAPKQYAILECFLRHPQQVFSHRALLDQVWQSAEAPGEEAVRVHIKELRKNLKAAGAPEDLIETIYRVGYRLNPLYSEGATGNLPAAPPSTAASSPPVSSNGTSQTRLVSASTRAGPSRSGQNWDAIQPVSGSAWQQLQARNEELEQQVTDLTAALAEANRQLQQCNPVQSLEGLDQRIHQLAHDLNNVFTPILGITQLLRLTQKDAAPMLQEQLKLLEENVKRGAHLVKQMLRTKQKADEA